MMDDYNDTEYVAAVQQAKANLEDLRERGIEALGADDEWENLRREYFTPEENAAADLEAEIMGIITLAQREKDSAKFFNEQGNMPQAIVSRLEKEIHSKQVNNLNKLLLPLGVRLSVAPV